VGWSPGHSIELFQVPVSDFSTSHLFSRREIAKVHLHYIGDEDGVGRVIRTSFDYRCLKRIVDSSWKVRGCPQTEFEIVASIGKKRIPPDERAFCDVHRHFEGP